MSTDLIHVEPDAVALESDPSAYMAVVLHRAKGWLAEARSIDAVRDTKAIAVGYESVIREKELAFDAQLTATELVRRCERRIGELVREGQERGDVLRAREGGGWNKHLQVRRTEPEDAPARPVDVAGVGQSTLTEGYYPMADAPEEQFEAAIEDAKAEGNLSRANVVRKVKGEEPKPPERSEWHRKRRHIDSNRILSSLTQELDAATAGLELMEPDDLDPDLLAECVPLIRASLKTINNHIKRVQNA